MTAGILVAARDKAIALGVTGGRPRVPMCVRERRDFLRREHIALNRSLSDLAFRLRSANHITEEESMLLYAQAEEVWDDAIHVASPEDPLRSLCGSYGRNLADLPEVPDSGSGCWTCIDKALTSITDASGVPQDPLSAPLVEPPHEKEEVRVGDDGLSAVVVARNEIELMWRAMLEDADSSDDTGEHIGFARHYRAVARGLGDALRVLDAALTSEEVSEPGGDRRDRDSSEAGNARLPGSLTSPPLVPHDQGEWARIEEMASRVRLLGIDEEACEDLDDRIGCRHFREQAERDLGRFVASLPRTVLSRLTGDTGEVSSE